MGPNNTMDPITLAASSVPMIGNTSKNTGAADGQFQKLMDQYANAAEKPAQSTETTPSASDKPQYATDETHDDTATDGTTTATDKAEVQDEAPKAEDDPLEQMKRLAEYGYILARPEGSIGTLTLNGQEYLRDEYYIGWKGDNCVVIPDSGLDEEQLGEILNGQSQIFAEGDEFSGVLEPPQTILAPGEPLTAQQMEGEPVTENVAAILEKTAAAAAKTDAEIAADTSPQVVQTVAAPKTEEDDSTQVQVTGHESAPTVFRNLQSAPIKVGETVQTSQTEQTEDVNDQLVQQIIPAVEQGQTKVELQLTPETLGSVKVEITQAENGTLHVAISAQNTEARNLLAKNADGLQSLLAARSQAPVQVEVQRQEESQANNSYDGHNGHPEQQQQQKQQQSEHARSGEDFLHQLRLGLVDGLDDDT